MKILFLSFLLFNFAVNAKEVELNEVRLLFHNSATNEDSCKKLMTVLNQYNECNNPTLAAYKACATMMISKYIFNPVNKLANFNQGKKLLEKCVQAEKENIEIRYLRFTIQSNVPFFLGYSSSISNDKAVLLSSVNELKDLQLKQMIISFMRSSEYLSSTEKQKLKS